MRSVAIGGMQNLQRVVYYMISPFSRIPNDIGIWNFISAFGMYVLFSIVIIFSVLVAVTIMSLGGITTFTSAAQAWQWITGAAQTNILLFMQLVWQIFLLILILIATLIYVFGPRLLNAAYVMFARNVWVKGWRQILWRTLVAPFIASFFTMLLAFLIANIMLSISLFLGLIYLISAFVISMLAILLMITAWISFWQQMRNYLYKRANESYSVSFFILFATFKGFAVLAGIPIITKITYDLAAYAIYISLDPYETLRETTLGRVLYDASKALFEAVSYIYLIPLLVTVVIVIALILEVFDLLQLASVIPQLLRKAMLRGLRISQEYGEPGFLTTVDVKQPSLEIMKLVVIYGTVVGYFVFTMFIVMYVIPALFRVAVITI